ncbi:class I SAM-dependent methyltransferase [Psychroflexus sp. ALD_RP9]|uniref:class I SAM-dependent methyltransferase n=1 Tax=Psychroflexus sp. ALD_RP9 TaxID=2777186 RepID=UPI001A906F4A|nr:class I SAM-dependent methyltransferase [Psychroflexus sp. ALD_RP9]QSS98133.1 class I SAM-dependent methyltransferase [Psychroflexus sp. ALD_RP9]
MEITDWAHSKEKFKLETVQKGVYKLSEIPESLEKYYNFNDYISHHNQKKTLTEKIYQGVKHLMFKKKLNLINQYTSQKTLKILDYGCGVGEFVSYLKDNGHQADGFEPNENARKIAIDNGVRLVNESLNQHKYDVICLYHVLEHIEDIDDKLKMLYNHLNYDGILIIAVPNHDAFDAKYYKTCWAAWDVPRHIWHFNKNGLRNLIESYSFKLIKRKPLWFDALYISMISETYKKSSRLKGLMVGLISNLSGLFTKNYSSNQFVFKKLK